MNSHLTSKLSSNEIRAQFLSFFAAKNHQVVPSSSLVPTDDPTLLFTNAGMNQFKDVFLGFDKRAYLRAATAQKCVRAGGKHNDLENVGYTARHHTFFEMLGNFSFGDYFKSDAISYAWELLTEVYKLPKDRLWVTVYAEDDEAFDIWTQKIGLADERVIRIGDNKGARYASDNFWMMGDTGPCGPCSEIFYDHGAHIAGGLPGSANEDGDRYIEIWNNVFMQYNRDENGVMHLLPKPSVDTGMGLERISAILQSVHSNYEIDIFQGLISAAARETSAENLQSPSLKVLADHIRAASFLIADGIIPGNEGRGYVLRRIIRRAIRHGYKLSARAPFFYKLVPDLVQEMGEAYPELSKEKTRVMDVLRQEETRFFATIENGMTILESALNALDGKPLAGEIAFRLHDTYGFPLDLTADICRERDIKVDEAGFHAEMGKQKDKARAAGKFKIAANLEYAGENSVFHGYESLEKEAKILALYKEGKSVEALEEGDLGVIVLDHTPFYAESGGQMGDSGVLQSAQGIFKVEDTQKIQAAVFGHQGILQTGKMAVGDALRARVNKESRTATMRNHSATHLLHKALREVLGEHVAQKGSQVDAMKTRFDFIHNQPMSADEIRQVEALVNAEILQNSAVETRVLAIEEAQKLGAMMLFGEKYGETVRVLDIGNSRELCGGTHVNRTGDIGVCRVVAETGIAAGIRRIEAVTGNNALTLIEANENVLKNIASSLKVPAQEAFNRVETVLLEVKTLEKELAATKAKLASLDAADLSAKALEINGIKVLACELKNADANTLRGTIDKLRDQLNSAVIILASVENGKITLISGVTPDLTSKYKAGELAGFVAAQVGGKGGGRADMAQAGGNDPAKLTEALASVANWVREKS